MRPGKLDNQISKELNSNKKKDKKDTQIESYKKIICMPVSAGT
jgi:hypothetical protein